MKRFRAVSILLVTVSAFIVAVPLLARANQYDVGAGQTVVLAKDAVIDDNYVRAAQTVEINGKVMGDAVLAASTITISGDVRGDVLAVGGTVRITGDVGGSVRVGAGDVMITGHVGRNVTVGSGTLLLGEESKVDGTAAFGAGTAELRGAVGGNVDGYAGTVVVAGALKSHARFNLGESDERIATLTLLADASVAGDLTYTSSAPADLQQGAIVSGAVTRRAPSGTLQNFDEAFRNFWLFSNIVAALGALVVAIVILALFRGETRVILDEMRQRPLKSIAFGILYAIGTPIVILILLTTMVGVPLALILLALYLIALYVAELFAGLLVGTWLLKALRRSAPPTSEAPPSPWLLLLGVIVYSLVLDFLLGWPWGDHPVAVALSALAGLTKIVFGVWALGAIVEGKRKLFVRG